MIKTTIPEIDVEELMARVRAKVAEARPAPPLTGQTTTSDMPRRARVGGLPEFTPIKPVNAQRERLEQMLDEARTKTEAPGWVPKPFRRFFRKQGGYNRMLLDTVAVLIRTNAELAKRLEEAGTALNAQQKWFQRYAEQADRIAQEVESLDARAARDGAYLKAQLAQHAALFARGTPAAPGDKPVAKESSGQGLDAFYAALQDRFRTSGSKVIEHLHGYLRYLSQASAGTAERPVVDLGCGRGDWLDFLKDQGLRASGVDNNGELVARCRACGLAVSQSDAITHLRTLPNDSLGAVTAFHLIEQLPVERLIELFTETWRVLVAGGVAIFEARNCNNLLVGACEVHIDPRNRNLFHPETVKLILELCGFAQLEIAYLQRRAGSPFDRATAQSACLDDLLFGPEDYAIIARKTIAG